MAECVICGGKTDSELFPPICAICATTNFSAGMVARLLMHLRETDQEIQELKRRVAELEQPW